MRDTRERYQIAVIAVIARHRRHRVWGQAASYHTDDLISLAAIRTASGESSVLFLMTAMSWR
ncbi:MAG TPA: hypothetical protein VKE93_02555 [Candidatus Angelobacter sp.]|nr:hypothetical protein [Candidatus Angelobacter sp.]